MMNLCRFFGFLAVTVLCLQAAPPAPPDSKDRIQPAKVEITGRGYVVERLLNGAQAFRARDYVWSDVPSTVQGLSYTQMAGGGTATIHIKAREAGTVFVAVAASQILELKEKGWKLPMPERSNSFTYNDVNQTLMIILSRTVVEGEELDIPQFGWAGTIVLLSAEPRGLKAI